MGNSTRCVYGRILLLPDCSWLILSQVEGLPVTARFHGALVTINIHCDLFLVGDSMYGDIIRGQVLWLEGTIWRAGPMIVFSSKIITN